MSDSLSSGFRLQAEPVEQAAARSFCPALRQKPGQPIHVGHPLGRKRRADEFGGNDLAPQRAEHVARSVERSSRIQCLVHETPIQLDREGADTGVAHLKPVGAVGHHFAAEHLRGSARGILRCELAEFDFDTDPAIAVVPQKAVLMFVFHIKEVGLFAAQSTSGRVFGRSVSGLTRVRRGGTANRR